MKLLAPSLCRSAALLSLLLAVGPAAQGQSTNEVQPVREPAVATAGQVSGTVASPQVQPEAAAASPTQLREARITPGDLLEVKVFGVPELSQEARVDAAGQVSLPLVGAVRVAGMTSGEAKAAIEGALQGGGFLKNPQVTLNVKEFATQGVTILGEVSKPGIYPAHGARRLFDVLSMAGGLTPRAGKRVSITRRDAPSEPVSVEIGSEPGKSNEGNAEVLPGDTIVVARAGVVYVVGAVSRPAGFVMENNERMTVLQALALAGGAAPGASMGKARIIRKGEGGLKEIAMPLDKILQAKADDMPLQADDILFVPSSAAKGVARRGLESIVAITTGIAIYRGQ